MLPMALEKREYIVKLTEDDVASFLAYRALVGGRKLKAVDQMK